MPIIRSVALAAAVALCLVAATPAQAHGASRTNVAIITELPSSVRLAPGQKVRIRLSTNVTTGYSWIANGGCCTKKGQQIVRISNGKYRAPQNTDGMVGVPGETTWTITAVRPGRTTVTIVTRPPGVENTMQDETVGTLRVTVTR